MSKSGKPEQLTKALNIVDRALTSTKDLPTPTEEVRGALKLLSEEIKKPGIALKLSSSIVKKLGIASKLPSSVTNKLTSDVYDEVLSSLNASLKNARNHEVVKEVISTIGKGSVNYNGALMAAVYEGKIDVVRALLENSAADIHYSPKTQKGTPSKTSPLMVALKPKDGHSNPQMVQLLIEKGASKQDIYPDRGETPLYAAVEYNAPDAIRMLVKLGAEVNFDQTLYYAALHNAPDAIEMLVGLGVKVNARDLEGYTPLHFAAAYNAPDAIRVLKELGANVNARHDFDRTPLHMAAQYNAPNAIRALKELGADVNARDWNHQTPLHMATRLRDFNCVNLLLHHSDPRRFPEGHIVSTGLIYLLHRIPQDEDRTLFPDNDILRFFDECRAYNWDGVGEPPPLPGEWGQRFAEIIQRLNREAGGMRAIGGGGVASEVHAEVFHGPRQALLAQLLRDNSDERVQQNGGHAFRTLDFSNKDKVTAVLRDFYQNHLVKYLGCGALTDFPKELLAFGDFDADKERRLSAFVEAQKAKPDAGGGAHSPDAIAKAIRGFYCTVQDNRMGRTTQTQLGSDITLGQLAALIANEAMCLGDDMSKEVKVLRHDALQNKWVECTESKENILVHLCTAFRNNEGAYGIGDKERASCAAGCYERVVDCISGACSVFVPVYVAEHIENEITNTVKTIIANSTTGKETLSEKDRAEITEAIHEQLKKEEQVARRLMGTSFPEEKWQRCIAAITPKYVQNKFSEARGLEDDLETKKEMARVSLEKAERDSRLPIERERAQHLRTLQERFKTKTELLGAPIKKPTRTKSATRFGPKPGDNPGSKRSSSRGR